MSLIVEPVSAGTGEPTGHAEVWELVRLAQAGDSVAFGDLYSRYVGIVHSYIRCRVGDHALAEDLTSDVFMRAFSRINTVTYLGKDFVAWLLTIARNLVLDYRKSAVCRLVQPVETTDLTPGTEPSAEALALGILDVERVRAAIKQLPTQQRRCITLRFLIGASIRETAATLGMEEGALKSLQHRAIRRLVLALSDSDPCAA